jgi:ribosome-associated toxin RatA of RatAB toxin-antitoxin module
VVFKTNKLLTAAVTLAACLGINCSAMPSIAKDHQQADNIVVADEQINSKPYQVARVLVKSSPQQVWQILTDYNSASKTFPTLKKCQVIADAGNCKRIHYQIRPTQSFSCFEYDLDVHETPHKMIEWHRASGDFKDLEGYWKLEPQDGGRSTLVTYASHVNGGFLLPQALIKRQGRMDFPQVMTALRSTAESTTQIASRAGHSHTAN